jgi:hypothetical protein
MDKTFSITLTLTACVFALTVVLFAVAVIDLNDEPSDPTAEISTAPQVG